MEATIDQPIITFLSSIGVSGITGLIVFLWIKKDKQYTDLADKVLIAYQDQTRASAELKSAIEANTKVIESNTKVTERLQDTITTKVFDVLKG